MKAHANVVTLSGDGWCKAKTIRRTVPRETKVKSGRPLQRVFVDLTGPYPPSAGGARYCMLVVDGNTNVGWPPFLRTRTVLPFATPFASGTSPWSNHKTE